MSTTKACKNHFPVLLRTAKLAQNTVQYDFVLQSLHKLLPSNRCLLQKLAKTTSQYYFVLQSLHKALPSTTLYYKACTNHFPVLLCNTKLAQSTSQYYFVLQSLHKPLPSTTSYCKACTNYFPVTDVYYKSLQKPLPSTTSYYKACTKHSPVLLRTAKLAQSTSQYYFVLQSLQKTRFSFVLQCSHKPLPSTTSYYKACTKHSPVLLCTTRLAQNTSQYYFVLQSLRKPLPSTTLYYKACTKHSPVLLRTTKLAENTFQYYFVLQSLQKTLPSTTLYYKACTLSGIRHSELEGYTVSTPLEVAYATRSGIRHSKWHTPLEVAYATWSGIRHSKWHATWSGMKWHEVAKSKSTTFARSLQSHQWTVYFGGLPFTMGSISTTHFIILSFQTP